MSEMTLQLILEHLKNNGYIQSYLQLQKQTNINLKQFPRQIIFFRRIILNGDFSQAVRFIWTFQNKINKQKLKELTLIILKQKLYELLENPQQNQLRNLFQKQIVNLCEQQQYQHLFTLLTCKSAQQIPGMENWTQIRGRYECFQSILPQLQRIFPSVFTKVKYYQFNLDDAVNNMINNIQDNRNIKNVTQSSVKVSMKESNKYFNTSNIQNHPNIPQNTANQLQISESRVEKSQAFLQKSRIPAIQASGTYNKLFNTYMEGSNISKSKQMVDSKSIKYPRHDIKVEDCIDSQRQIKQVKPKKQNSSSYLKEFQRQKQHNQSSMLQEQVRRNIAYLDPNNESELRQEQNFTFSHGPQQSVLHSKQRKIIKLATVQDPKAIRTCQFSVSGNYFALGTNSSFLKIYDVAQLFYNNVQSQILPCLEIPQLHSKSIFSLDWSLNEKAIVTCSNDLTIKITQFQQPLNFDHYKKTVIGRHQSCIRMVKFNSMQTKVVSCGDDKLIKIWDIEKTKKCLSLQGHRQGVSAFKFSESQDQSILFSASKDSTIIKWDLRIGSIVSQSEPSQSQITFIANNTQRIVVSHKNGSVTFLDQQLHEVQSFKLHEQQIRSIDGNSYDDLLLTASFDGHVCMFQPKSMQNPHYHSHNQHHDDKVVFATFLNHQQFKGFASTSTMGLCNIYSYQ